MLYPIELRARTDIRTTLLQGCQERQDPLEYPHADMRRKTHRAACPDVSWRIRSTTWAEETPSVDTTWVAAA